MKDLVVDLNLFHTMLNDSHDMIFILRMDNFHLEYVNQTAIEVLGYSLDEMNEIGIESFRRSLEGDLSFHDHLNMLKDEKIMVDYAMLIKKDGSEFPVEANFKIVHKDGIDYNIAIVRDITVRFELENKLKKSNKNLAKIVQSKTSELMKNNAYLNSYKVAMDASSVVSRADFRGNITYVNENFCKLSGYTQHEVLGKPHNIVRHPDNPQTLFIDLWSTIKSKKIWKKIIKNRDKNGNDYWVDTTILPILNDNADIVEYIAVRHDVTKMILQQNKLDNIANTDILTGLGNRYKLLIDIENSISPALAIINLDNFSQINDFYGHVVGDAIIKEFGEKLNEAKYNKSCTIYHLQGDEYVIFHKNITKDKFIEKIINIANKLKDSIIVIKDEDLSFNFTTVISCEVKEKILATADMAIKIAKKENKSFLIYSDEISLNDEYANNIKWAKKIKLALESDNIIPLFQPIVNNQTLKYEKYEALVRLREDDKLISPYLFLDISKKTKHYTQITKIMIEKCFVMFQDKGVKFSLNLTIEDILNDEIKSYILSMLETYQIGKKVVFEIVESESIENFAEVEDFIKSVKEYGCKIAIDDFGTGYSNFEYLMKLNVDFIKIDGSLIKNIASNKNSKLVVKNIVQFAKDLGIKTIAEFVETKSILNVVQELKIDYSQGYYFSEPKKELY